MTWWFEVMLWKRVLLGLVLGVVFGLAVAEIMGEAKGTELLLQVKIVGDLFVQSIRLLIIPLIFFTLVAGVLALGSPSKLGSIGLKTIFLYLITTFFANVIGLTMGTVFRPGEGVDLGGAIPKTLDGGGTFLERMTEIVTKNPFEKLLQADPTHLALSVLLLLAGYYFALKARDKGPRSILFMVLLTLGIAMASLDILMVILISICFGIFVLFSGPLARPVTAFFELASDLVLKVTTIMMELAPFGVFGLIAYVAGTSGIEVFKSILILAIAVYLGCFLHMFIAYGGLIKLVLKFPLIKFFRGIVGAQMVAYSTSSSSATLPVTIAHVTENFGVSKSIAGSVLPLGSTINMDGTAMYLGIVALFTAQVFGYALEPYHYIMIAVTAAMVSVGAAGIPSASLFLLTPMLAVFGVSDAHVALIVGFIWPFDRLLDMMRTVTNVTGDAAVSVAVAKWEGELDETVFPGAAAGID
jgi:Na+/H+-dicarboxylate symporter